MSDASNDASDDADFGGRLYSALSGSRSHWSLPVRLNYADIQALKAASRSETLELFSKSNKLILERIENDSPEELAAYLIGFADGTEFGMMRGFIVFGLFS